MHPLAKLIKTHEEWLMKRVLAYAKKHNYTKYTSTLAEAWRISIAGLSDAVLQALEKSDAPPELDPDENYERDPVSAFGVIEARRHRERGIRLDMFLGLMKYYRQSYTDLVHETKLDPSTREQYRLFIERCFDRIEIGFCTEWAESPETKLLNELQSTNRRMTNEKNKYLTIFESLYAPVFLLDTEDWVIHVNHAAADLFEAFTVPGQTYYNPDQNKQKLDWLTEEMSQISSISENTLEFEKSLLTRQGLRHFQVKIQQMLDVSEKFSGTVVILNDMTEQKQAEQEREKFRQAIEQSPLSVVITDPNGDIEYVNPKFVEITGYTLKEVTGKNPRILKSGEQSEAYYKKLWETITAGQEWSGEFHNKRKDGSLFWEAASISPIKNSEGDITHFLGIKEDITEDKKTRERLEQLLKEKEILLKEVHHRVKNNFNVVASLLYLQSRQIEDEQARLFCRESRDRVQTMAEIHTQLYESKDLTNVRFAIYVDRLIRNLLHSYSINPSEIQVQKEIQEIELGVDAAIPCGLILNELMSNALKYAFPKETETPGLIRIVLKEENGTVQLLVRDNGVGMPPNFDMSKLESLGLQLVQMLSEQIHGQLEFLSEQGTCFSVTFQYPIKHEIDQV